jgi:hypothetical protein
MTRAVLHSSYGGDAAFVKIPRKLDRMDSVPCLQHRDSFEEGSAFDKKKLGSISGTVVSR